MSGMTIRDRITNEVIRRTVEVARVSKKERMMRYLPLKENSVARINTSSYLTKLIGDAVCLIMSLQS